MSILGCGYMLVSDTRFVHLHSPFINSWWFDTGTHTHTHTPPPHTNTDELIQAIRQDIAVASEKLEEPSMKELAVQLDDHLRTKHTDWQLANSVSIRSVLFIPTWLMVWPSDCSLPGQLSPLLLQKWVRLARLVLLMDVKFPLEFSSSLVPGPSLHMRERGSGVLNDFFCHSSSI